MSKVEGQGTQNFISRALRPLSSLCPLWLIFLSLFFVFFVPSRCVGNLVNSKRTPREGIFANLPNNLAILRNITGLAEECRTLHDVNFGS